MTIGNICKKTKKGVQALTDPLHDRGRPSLSPSVSATETSRRPNTPYNSRSPARNMDEGTASVNESSHQASVPRFTIRVLPEHQLSSTVASKADASQDRQYKFHGSRMASSHIGRPDGPLEIGLESQSNRRC